MKITTTKRCSEIEDSTRRDEGENTLSYRVGTSAGDMSDPNIQLIARRLGWGLKVDAPGATIKIENCSSEVRFRNAYVLCLSMERLPKFGPYCVRIDNPSGFHRAVTNALGNAGHITASWAAAVRYGSREFQDLDPTPADNPAYTKPEIFQDEKEIRLLWDAKSDVIEPFMIDCPRARRFCTRLSD